MKNVISVSLILVLVTSECRGNPKPQSYGASAVGGYPNNRQQATDSTFNQVAPLTTTPYYTRYQESQSNSNNANVGTQNGGVINQESSPWSGTTERTQPGRGQGDVGVKVQPTTSRPGWKNPGNAPGSMLTPADRNEDENRFGILSGQRAPSAPQSNSNGQVDHCDTTHINYPHPGSTTPATDHSLTFCCSWNLNHSSSANNEDEVADNPRLVNNDLRQFALDLLIKLADEDPKSNLVVSPFSVWNVLLMTLEGAEKNSASAKQIQATLYLHNATVAKIRSNFQELECSLRKASKYSQYISANAMFFDEKQPLKPDYEKIAQNNYQSNMINVNMSNTVRAADKVNSWVDEKTHGRIKTLVRPDDFQYKNLVITNAIFFKGQWDNPFNRTATSTQNFFNEQRRIVSSVDMMYQRGNYLYSFINEINAHVLDVPYEGKHFRMLIVLPQHNETLKNVLNAMKRFPVDACYERLVLEQEMYSDEDVHVYLPRFKIKSDLQLKPALRQMGIKEIFTAQAKLSKMSDSGLYVNKLVHAAEIEVNEEGTIASGVTGGLFGSKSKPPNFVANRPFAYFIVENQLKTVIFAGKVVDPMQRSRT